MIAVSPGTLQRATTPTQSVASLAARRAGSVAEASALAAAGPGAQLLATRHISPDRMATCAIAQGLPA
ncbi:cobalamin biosynthesis protein [Sphingomonas aurantiaca]|uniref:cobalamin biosynthesis protein n=1 Tax=Sphingomonas aurantiaca TaxID=185949 RepID=UPI002FE35D7D